MGLQALLRTDNRPAPPDDVAAAACELSALAGAVVYPESVTLSGRAAFFMARRGTEKLVGVAWAGDGVPSGLAGLGGEELQSGSLTCRLAAADNQVAYFLCESLPFLRPKVLGLAASLGLGDRLGLATPGHARALKGTGLAPCFCQQSIREMTRTGRSPRQVMSAAVLGAMEAGWRGGFGADADHLKTTEDIEYCREAGFTMFTFDPGDHVDSAAAPLEGRALEERYARLPWDAMECSGEDCRRAYAGRSETLCGGLRLTIAESDALRAAVKYGRAVAHVTRMYRYLASTAGAGSFEVEVSVDETDSPTTVAEHFYVASELSRLGVRWVGLAPRFVGRFEKGVDYIGDLGELKAALAGHAAVARTLGPYKLSIHSGSDKFSVYPLAAEACRNMVHVKTAGTSYLEALRTLAAGADVALFREILAFAAERYEEDRQSYHVSADLGKVLRGESLGDGDLPGALDQFDTREALHVTFGSVLNARDAHGQPRFKTRLMTALTEHEDLHYDMLARHLGRHAAPFARQ
jgi:hypothetical protein